MYLFSNLMILAATFQDLLHLYDFQSAMVAILFFKMRPNFLTAKHSQARTSHGPFLHSEAVGAMIREI